MVGGLTQAVGDEDEVVAFAPTGLRGRRRVEESLAGLEVERRLVTLPLARIWRRLWSRAQRPVVERVTGPLDVFHFSDWMYPAQRAGVRATTVHDLIPIRHRELVHPQTYRLHSSKLKNAAATCDVIFANSEFTAGEVADLLHVPTERIRVAYPGIADTFRPEGRRSDLGAPYILTVATLEPRKNLESLVHAFRLLRRRAPELLLVVAGPRAPRGAPESGPLSGDGVRLVGFVSDDELAALYRGARVFVYPSLYEGFGMPIVEALASGTPVVASAHASLDEASGAVVVRADATDPEALADAIGQVLTGRPGARDAGIAHSARFTWKACGEAVLNGYRSAL
jgi:glycosyltransferase involved in cell wall biosynthesis